MLKLNWRERTLSLTVRAVFLFFYLTNGAEIKGQESPSSSSKSLTHESPQQSTIQVQNPWIRPSKGPNTAGYMRLSLACKQPDDKMCHDRLLDVKVESSVCERVELHETREVKKDIFRMVPVKEIRISSENPTELKPGGKHLMFMNLRVPLTVDHKILLTFIFEKSPPVTVLVPVHSFSETTCSCH